MKRPSKVLYLVAILAEIVIRAPYNRQRKQQEMRDQRVSGLERGLLGLLFGTFLISMVYVFSSRLDRADYRWPEQTKQRVGGLGAVLMGIAIWIFWRAHRDLGQNWSPTLEIAERQTLVTRGIYQYIRHPMYASQWVWSVGQMLLLQNWIAGPLGLLGFVPMYFLRVPREEQMMLEHFGDEYRDYMAQTGRIFPRLRR
ncbi:MAG: isoprenylcysteine carboxylmethyltransferase family protein [Chloroflexi bacterium]|nr:isoprenylcysteine carboxylmethyltransferase family protein [Chloroflexota bacterium]